MSKPVTRLAALGALATLLLAGCGTPSAYRPEVDAFAQASSAVQSYIETKQGQVAEVRDDLRAAELKAKRPLLRISDDCQAATSALLNDATDRSTDCRLELADPDGDFDDQLLISGRQINDTAAFTDALVVYAGALDNVAQSGDKESFLEAANGLGDALISLAGSAADAAGKTRPDPGTFQPVANLVSLGAFYYLESKRREALISAATSAQPWIEDASEAIVSVLYSAEFELANADLERLRAQVDEANEAGPDSYVNDADQAIKQAGQLRRQLRTDPAAPYRKLPATHQKLLDAFEDRKRNLSAAVAAAQDLYQAARDAQSAIIDAREDPQQ